MLAKTAALNVAAVAGALLGAAALASCLESAPTQPQQTYALVANPPSSVVVLRNVDVAAMTGPELSLGQAIVAEDGRIAWIGPDAEVSVPAGAQVIDGDGGVVIPGLADMHVHVRDWELPAYVAYGVTTVRNMWGFATLRPFVAQTHQSLAAEASVSGLASPAIYSASPGFDATSKWPQTEILLDANQADARVASMSGQGWRYIKAYVDLTESVYDSVVASAARHRMPVIGHVPFRVSLTHALESRQRSIEHLSGYDRVATGGQPGAFAWLSADSTKLVSAAALTAEVGTWNCPTLVVLETIVARQRGTSDAATARRNLLAAVRQLHRAGARVLAGTDAGIDIVPAGRSLHDELSLLVASGFTPYEALRIATSDAAEFLDASEDFGTVAVGLRADLLVLKRNPLTDLSALGERTGIMLRGRWFVVQEEEHQRSQ